MKWPLSKTFQRLSTLSGDLHGRVVLAISLLSSLLALTTAMGCHTFLVAHDTSMPLTPSVAFGAVMWLWWAAVASGMWACARRFPALLTFSKKTAIVQAVAGSVVCLAHLALLQATLEAGFHWPAWRQAYSALNYVSLARFGAEWMAYALVYISSSFVHLLSQRQRDHADRVELQAQLAQAQLHALQAQLEPHFLFNTLNVLTSLVDLGRNREASITLGHLETILRTTLRTEPSSKVALREEVDLVESYLEIQKLRFAHRLQTEIVSTPEALEAMVPRFLLQPLIENAVLHGIAPLEHGGRIAASISRIGDQILFKVQNDGAGDAASPRGHGIGLHNTRERLARIYPEAHVFTAGSRMDGGFEVTIQIPFERRSC